MISNLLTYQSKLENIFDAFLRAIGSSQKTRTNYKSDLRNFFTWFSAHLGQTLPEGPQEFVRSISSHILELYKANLVTNSVPTSTINRRLSTLRMFLRACQEAGWITDNAGVGVINVTKFIEHKDKTHFQILAEFEIELVSQGAPKSTIRQYLSDVEHFLLWLKNA